MRTHRIPILATVIVLLAPIAVSSAAQAQTKVRPKPPVSDSVISRMQSCGSNRCLRGLRCQENPVEGPPPEWVQLYRCEPLRKVRIDSLCTPGYRPEGASGGPLPVGGGGYTCKPAGRLCTSGIPYPVANGYSCGFPYSG